MGKLDWHCTAIVINTSRSASVSHARRPTLANHEERNYRGQSSIVSCAAPAEILRERVRVRYQAGTDAAEADLAVLERQLATREALTIEELQHTIVIDTQQPFNPNAVAEKLLAFRLPKRSD